MSNVVDKVSTIALEAEQAVIGSMLMASDAAKRAHLELEASDFYMAKYATIFQTIATMLEEGGDAAIDVITVCQRLRLTGGLENAGGSEELTACVNMVATTAHLPHYCRLVKEFSLRRQFSTQISITGQEQTPENVDKLSDLVLRMQGQGVGRILDFQQDLDAVIEEILSKPVEGYATGFFGLDGILVRLEPGDLMTIGARTSGGKTVMMTTMMGNMARAGVSCLYCTMEMSDVQLVKRILPSVSNIEAYRFRSGSMTDIEKEAIRISAREQLNPLPIKIMSRPRTGIKEIRGAVVKSKAQVVFVDYLQRCQMPKAENRVYEIEEFMVQLKTFAQEAGVVVVLGAQLDRQSDKNPTVPPTLADLRGSGAIEHESDQVLLLWRPPDSVADKNRPDRIRPKAGNLAIEARIPKNRHGVAGVSADFELDGSLVTIAECGMNNKDPQIQEERWYQK